MTTNAVTMECWSSLTYGWLLYHCYYTNSIPLFFNSVSLIVASGSSNAVNMECRSSLIYGWLCYTTVIIPLMHHLYTTLIPLLYHCYATVIPLLFNSGVTHRGIWSNFQEVLACAIIFCACFFFYVFVLFV